MGRAPMPRCLATVFADMGEAVGDAEGAAAKRRAEISTGTRSRVWSVPRQVGSQPWSAVRITMSPGFRPAVEIGQACIEGFERGGIAGHVAAMAVEHVEVDEIGEDERPVFGLFRWLPDWRRRGPCCRCLGEPGHTLMGEDVPILPIACTVRPASCSRSKNRSARAAAPE